jgi:hypothetical protein
MSGER